MAIVRIIWKRLCYNLILLPFLPLLFLAYLPQIPNAFTLLSESDDPWYCEITTGLTFLFHFYVIPPLMVGEIMGLRTTYKLSIPIFSPIQWVLMVAYAGVLSYYCFTFVRWWFVDSVKLLSRGSKASA